MKKNQKGPVSRIIPGFRALSRANSRPNGLSFWNLADMTPASGLLDEKKLKKKGF